MINIQIYHIHQFISEFLEFQKYAYESDCYRLFCFGRFFCVTEVCVSYRLLHTVLFLTDSVFRVLFAYFDESMANIGGMNHREVGRQ